MEAPVCSICSQKHFGAGHIWPKTEKEKANVGRNGRDVAEGRGEAGDVLQKPEGGHQGDDKVLQEEAPGKGGEQGGYSDFGKAELPGEKIHQTLPEGERTIPGKQDSVQISVQGKRIGFDRKTYQREYMRKWRAKK